MATTSRNQLAGTAYFRQDLKFEPVRPVMAARMYSAAARSTLSIRHLQSISGLNTTQRKLTSNISRQGNLRKMTDHSVVRATSAQPSTAFQSQPGFTQLADTAIPDALNLPEIVKSLPPEVFEIDEVKSWKNVAITLTAVALGYAALAVVPWYLYPIVYVYLGTAVTGIFVIAHDCGHCSFSNNKLVNDVVGTILMMPLIYPFEPWRIKHNTHHAHTNKLIMDTAWQPFRPYQYEKSPPTAKALMEAMMGPFWWIASVGHWLLWHFDLNKFRPQERGKVKVSLCAVGAFVVCVLMPLLVTQGPVGLIKWWFLPWLGFHFWMSTFTMLHHTAPHIPWKGGREWNAAEAALVGTVHCEYPAWVDFLCHDISVHIPHHVSSRIPSYNLRKAYDSLKQNYDKHMNKAVFGPELILTVISKCQLYDTHEKRWLKFKRITREESTVPVDTTTNN